MKVRINPRWDRDTVDVYVYQPGPGTNRILRFVIDDDGQSYKWEEAPEFATIKPSFELPKDVLQLLVAEAGDYLPPSAATDLALKDAREVRDRLLGLVEHTLKSPHQP